MALLILQDDYPGVDQLFQYLVSQGYGGSIDDMIYQYGVAQGAGTDICSIILYFAKQQLPIVGTPLAAWDLRDHGAMTLNGTEVLSVPNLISGGNPLEAIAGGTRRANINDGGGVLFRADTLNAAVNLNTDNILLAMVSKHDIDAQTPAMSAGVADGITSTSYWDVRVNSAGTVQSFDSASSNFIGAGGSATTVRVSIATREAGVAQRVRSDSNITEDTSPLPDAAASDLYTHIHLGRLSDTAFPGSGEVLYAAVYDRDNLGTTEDGILDFLETIT